MWPSSWAPSPCRYWECRGREGPRDSPQVPSAQHYSPSQLQEAHELARSARTHAQETLGRSQAARTHMEESTAGLRDFIRRIKAFLAGRGGRRGWGRAMQALGCTACAERCCVSAEEGADPESIELVARQVLNISLPSSPGRIHHLLQEIRDSLSGLDSVDAILNGTARGLAAARDLLAQARQAQ